LVYSVYSVYSCLVLVAASACPECLTTRLSRAAWPILGQLRAVSDMLSPASTAGLYSWWKHNT
jgi:hypothetical protein